MNLDKLTAFLEELRVSKSRTVSLGTLMCARDASAADTTHLVEVRCCLHSALCFHQTVGSLLIDCQEDLLLIIDILLRQNCLVARVALAFCMQLAGLFACCTCLLVLVVLFTCCRLILLICTNSLPTWQQTLSKVQRSTLV